MNLIFVVTGPSGVGKSTIYEQILSTLGHCLKKSLSATTRDPRPGEEHGVDYLFVTQEQFDADKDAGLFLEHAGVFGRSYGTYASTVDKILETHSVLMDLDIQGHRSVRELRPESIHIFIKPPSLEVLRERLEGRGDPKDIIDRRMSEAQEIMDVSYEFDYVILNDDLNTAVMAILGIMLAELEGLF